MGHKCANSDSRPNIDIIWAISISSRYRPDLGSISTRFRPDIEIRVLFAIPVKKGSIRSKHSCCKVYCGSSGSGRLAQYSKHSRCKVYCGSPFSEITHFTSLNSNSSRNIDKYRILQILDLVQRNSQIPWKDLVSSI